MRGKLPLAVLIALSALFGSCSSFAYLHSDDYVQAGIQITTNPKTVSGMHAVNQWSSELGITYSAQDVGVWAANRLAKDGRHNVLILIELISAYDPPNRDLMQAENMWRISVFPLEGGREDPSSSRSQ